MSVPTPLVAVSSPENISAVVLSCSLGTPFETTRVLTAHPSFCTSVQHLQNRKPRIPFASPVTCRASGSSSHPSTVSPQYFMPSCTTIGPATSAALSAPKSAFTSASANSMAVPGPRLVMTVPSTTTRSSLHTQETASHSELCGPCGPSCSQSGRLPFSGRPKGQRPS